MKLKKMRVGKGFSQSELSKLSGINLRTLQNYEQGVRSIGSAPISSIFKLCIALDCSIDDIVDDEELQLLYYKYLHTVFRR